MDITVGKRRTIAVGLYDENNQEIKIPGATITWSVDTPGVGAVVTEGDLVYFVGIGPGQVVLTGHVETPGGQHRDVSDTVNVSAAQPAEPLIASLAIIYGAEENVPAAPPA